MLQARNVVLVGPMGAGKSTIGRALAEQLGYVFRDTDTLIEERTGANIAWIFDVEGEEGKKWAALGMELLTQALAEWGIGGKTNAGYGRLELVESSTPTDAPAPTNSPTSNTAAANKQEKKGKNRKK